MALAPFLLDFLVCPASRQPLSLAPADRVAALNEAIARGEVVDEGGEAVSDAVDALLLRADGAVAYPVRNDIPELLVERGIAQEAS